MVDDFDTPSATQPKPQSKDFDVRIASLPKVELHIHLEGAIRRQTLQELVRRSDTPIALGDAPWARRDFQYNDLSHFVTTARALLNTCLQKPEDYERIACELFAELAEQNVRYVEVSFDPSRGLRLGISFDEMLAAINTAKRRIVNERAIRVGLIVGLGRERGANIAAKYAREAADGAFLPDEKRATLRREIEHDFVK